MKVDIEKVVSHLEKKWGQDKACPMCGNTEWHVNDTIFELREYHLNFNITGVVYPVVPITCMNCHAAQFVNAVGLGLLEPDVKGDKNDK